MKKFLVTFALLFAVVNIMAQEHLSFKGIPIEGSLTEFCQKLESKGLTLSWQSDTSAHFTGDFTSRNATVHAFATDDGKNVNLIVVIFDKTSEWNILANTYDYCKDLYIRKYGEPSTCQEDNLRLDAGNSYIMHQLGDGRIKYKSVWNVAGGTIELSIERGASDLGIVVIQYSDAQYLETKLKKDLEDI